MYREYVALSMPSPFKALDEFFDELEDPTTVSLARKAAKRNGMHSMQWKGAETDSRRVRVIDAMSTNNDAMDIVLLGFHWTSTR
jgi:hypothetical protein